VRAWEGHVCNHDQLFPVWALLPVCLDGENADHQEFPSNNRKDIAAIGQVSVCVAD
jgi:hypothetical protein